MLPQEGLAVSKLSGSINGRDRPIALEIYKEKALSCHPCFPNHFCRWSGCR